MSLYGTGEGWPRFAVILQSQKLRPVKWIKESLWKNREAINEVGACSLGLWAGILWRPQKYLIWFKCDVKKRRERYLINNSLQLG